jgi:hypothetical protein
MSTLSAGGENRKTGHAYRLFFCKYMIPRSQTGTRARFWSSYHWSITLRSCFRRRDYTPSGTVPQPFRHGLPLAKRGALPPGLRRRIGETAHFCHLARLDPPNAAPPPAAWDSVEPRPSVCRGFASMPAACPIISPALARQAYQRREAALALVKTPGGRARAPGVGSPDPLATHRRPAGTHAAQTQQTGGFERPAIDWSCSATRAGPACASPPTSISRRPRPPSRPFCFRWATASTARPTTLSEGVPGPRPPRLRRAGLRPDRPGRAHIPTKRATPTKSIPGSGRQMLLSGDTATRLQLWDAVRSLDVLCGLCRWSIPSALASMGQSGGATLTMLLAAVDSRLALRRRFVGQHRELRLRRLQPAGLHRRRRAESHRLRPAWLRPLGPALPAGAQAAADIGERARLVRHLLALVSPADRIEWKTTALPHALTHQMRLYSYEFLERWLHGANHAVRRAGGEIPNRMSNFWLASRARARPSPRRRPDPLMLPRCARCCASTRRRPPLRAPFRS